MQSKLALFEDIDDALRDVVRDLGGTKVVGHWLRPDFQPDQAGAWLKDCLNSERREKLSPRQVMAILRRARDSGHHQLMEFIAGDSGYSTQPIEPRDELAELQRQFISAVKQSKHIADRLDRMTQPPLSVAK
jgi:hypothetical protein